MATSSTGEDVLAIVTNMEGGVVVRASESIIATSRQPLEQERSESLHPPFPWSLLCLVWEFRRRGRTEEINGLPLPVGAESQSQSWLYRIIYSAQRRIIERARGRRGGDALTSLPLTCSATLHFAFSEYVFGTSTSIDSWLQPLRASVLCLWGFSYYIYNTRGTPRTMNEVELSWFRAIMVVNCLVTIILAQESTLLLPGILWIITVSTAAALWVQKFYFAVSRRVAAALFLRSNNRLDERLVEP